MRSVGPASSPAAGSTSIRPRGDVGRAARTLTRPSARAATATEARAGPTSTSATRSSSPAASNGFLRHAIHNGRPGTPMPAFGSTLGEQRVEDVLALLRSWQTPPTRDAARHRCPRRRFRSGRCRSTHMAPSPTVSRPYPATTPADVVKAQLDSPARHGVARCARSFRLHERAHCGSGERALLRSSSLRRGAAQERVARLLLLVSACRVEQPRAERWSPRDSARSPCSTKVSASGRSRSTARPPAKSPDAHFFGANTRRSAATISVSTAPKRLSSCEFESWYRLVIAALTSSTMPFCSGHDRSLHRARAGPVALRDLTRAHSLQEIELENGADAGGQSQESRFESLAELFAVCVLSRRASRDRAPRRAPPTRDRPGPLARCGGDPPPSSPPIPEPMPRADRDRRTRRSWVAHRRCRAACASANLAQSPRPLVPRLLARRGATFAQCKRSRNGPWRACFLRRQPQAR